MAPHNAPTKSKQTADLIKQLAAECPSVKCTRCVLEQALVALVCASVFIAAWRALAGTHSAMYHSMPMERFYTHIAWLSIVGVLAGVSVFWDSLRGGGLLQRIARVASGAALGLFTAFLLWQGGRLVHTNSPVWFYEESLVCGASILVVSLLISLSTVYAAKTAGVLSPLRAGVMAGLFGGSFGVIGRMLICPLNDPAQLLLFHISPVVCATVIVALCGQRLLRW